MSTPSLPEFKITDTFVWFDVNVRRYGSIAILVIGLTGNTLSYLAMSRRRNTKSVMCFYFRMLAIADGTALISGMIPMFVLSNWPQLLLNQTVGTASCVSFYLFTFVFHNISLWMVFIIAVDRFIAVRFPLKVMSWCTMRRAKIIFIINVIVHIIAYGPNMFRYSVPDVSTLNVMCLMPYPIEVYHTANEVIEAVFDVIMPLTGICIFNASIIYILRSSKVDLGDAVHAKSRNKQERSLTIMLVVVASTLLFLEVPYTLAFFVWAFLHVSGYASVKFLTMNIGVTFCMLNNAVNFFLYFASSSKFRDDLRLVFRGGSKENKSQSSTASSSLP